jgi:hypothetical protein
VAPTSALSLLVATAETLACPIHYPPNFFSSGRNVAQELPQRRHVARPTLWPIRWEQSRRDAILLRMGGRSSKRYISISLNWQCLVLIAG